ncbi:hypothetical protein Psi02_71810 [Planotetraspora silvatica]|uniref:DUF4352 domain-containing protein n=2 Tax=Planotetraspora silvatica TaxID=234614 RepID=A0A8J3UVS8_9ACTN|nr:hypothetical protein Psi02_71810 [Planotetraspora silvatica]
MVVLMRRIGGGRFARAILFSIIATVVGIALDAAISFAGKDWTNPVGLGLVVGLVAITGVITVVQGDGGSPPSAPSDQIRWPPASPQKRSRGMPAFAAVLLVIALCGGGAAAVALGVRYVGGYVTGDETGTNVLRAQKTTTSGSLTLTVRRILVTSHFTRVELSARNRGSESLSLPVYGYSQLSAADGTTLSGDPFRSRWPTAVPPGVRVDGVVVFPGHLPSDTKRASFSFTHVFSLEADHATVANLAIKPAPTG